MDRRFGCDATRAFLRNKGIGYTIALCSNWEAIYVNMINRLDLQLDEYTIHHNKHSNEIYSTIRNYDINSKEHVLFQTINYKFQLLSKKKGLPKLSNSCTPLPMARKSINLLLKMEDADLKYLLTKLHEEPRKYQLFVL